MADIDFSGLWSWSLPLWGLFILVLFLVGVLRAPIVLEGIMPAAAVAVVTSAAGPPVMEGGARTRKDRRVRFADA